MLDSEFIEATLGVTKEKLRASRLQDVQQANLHFISQVEHSLCIFSRDLDPRLLNNRYIERAVSEIGKRSRHSMVRLLVFDSRPLQTANHRLISVAQKLSSYVQFRIVDKDFQDLPYTFYLGDDCGMVYRPMHTEFDSEYWFNNKSLVAEKQKQFNDIWEHSRVASELRSLGL